MARVADPDDGPPRPVKTGTRAFDKAHHQRVRRAKIALGATQQGPSERSTRDFDANVEAIRRSRYVLDAPVEQGAALYPDPIWGVHPARLSEASQRATPSCARVAQPRTTAGAGRVSLSSLWSCCNASMVLSIGSWRASLSASTAAPEPS